VKTGVSTWRNHTRWKYICYLLLYRWHLPKERKIRIQKNAQIIQFSMLSRDSQLLISAIARQWIAGLFKG
jgi:hypothetical protein